MKFNICTIGIKKRERRRRIETKFVFSLKYKKGPKSRSQLINLEVLGVLRVVVPLSLSLRKQQPRSQGHFREKVVGTRLRKQTTRKSLTREILGTRRACVSPGPPGVRAAIFSRFTFAPRTADYAKDGLHVLWRSKIFQDILHGMETETNFAAVKSVQANPNATSPQYTEHRKLSRNFFAICI